MTRGRKPTPTNLRRLRGNPGRRPLPENEPKPTVSDTCPPPPGEINRKARLVWKHKAPELHRLGLLTDVDLPLFAAWCVAYARWREAEERVYELGLITTTPKGYPIQNPYLGIANTAMKALREIGSEFGMGPAARTRLKVGEPETTPAEDPLSAFLTGGRRA
jgi:P27 family predicted phage terminase small subunit